ncbi:hypothetical protein MNV49_000841 [Pseudohyphozyma bogoriensis]|nr:hypothetical protein MNV49_000841 [Pseudohyphozyma bogoriensis]
MSLHSSQFHPQPQRPSLSYFIFLSILFYTLQNNQVNPYERDSRDAARLALQRDQLVRDGVAEAIGEPLKYNTTAKLIGAEEGNVTDIHAIPYEVGTVDVPAMVRTQVADVLRLDGRAKAVEGRGMPMNVSGFIRGPWEAITSLQELGLDETFNLTRQVPREEVAEDGARGNANATVVRRAEEATDKDKALKVDEMVNKTRTYNRTTLRGDFDFTTPGKMHWDLIEWQEWAVGPFVEDAKGRDDDGELLIEREPKEEWEKEGPAVFISGPLQFYSGRNTLGLDLEGVHFLHHGLIMGFATTSSSTLIPSATSPDTADLLLLPFVPNSLPSITPNSSLLTNLTTHVILPEFDRRITRELHALNYPFNQPLTFPPSSDDPNCAFLFFASLDPLPKHYTPSLYREYYRSLFHPTGSSLTPPPPPRLQYTLYSENCGVMLKGEGTAIPNPSIWSRVTNLAILLTIAQAVILWTMVKQMEASGTGSGAMQIAYWVVGLQTAMDGYTFVLTLMLSMQSYSQANFPLLVPTFLSLISVIRFGVNFATIIASANAQSRPRVAPPPPPPPPPTREEMAARAAERRAESAGGEEGAPLLGGAAAAGEIGAAAGTQRDEEMSDLTLMVMGAVGAIAILFIIINWGWLNLMMVILYSYWVPQIILNVTRGAARNALRKDYILCTTIARLVLPVYMYACPKNLAGVEPSLQACLSGL